MSSAGPPQVTCRQFRRCPRRSRHKIPYRGFLPLHTCNGYGWNKSSKVMTELISDAWGFLTSPEEATIVS